MNIHVITPFSRYHLLSKLVKHLRPFAVHWHPVTSGQPLIVDKRDESWIHARALAGADDAFDACYIKLDYWLRTTHIEPEDYYVFMCDDDGYTPNFFDQLRECTHDVVFVTVLGRTFFQNPCPANCRVGASGLRSYCVKGTAAMWMRFVLDRHDADGVMAEGLHEMMHISRQSFRPDMIALYNYFEDGRWTDPLFSGLRGLALRELEQAGPATLPTL